MTIYNYNRALNGEDFIRDIKSCYPSLEHEIAGSLKERLEEVFFQVMQWREGKGPLSADLLHLPLLDRTEMVLIRLQDLPSGKPFKEVALYVKVNDLSKTTLKPVRPKLWVVTSYVKQQNSFCSEWHSMQNSLSYVGTLDITPKVYLRENILLQKYGGQDFFDPLDPSQPKTFLRNTSLEKKFIRKYVELFIALARQVAVLHKSEYAHCDLKPENFVRYKKDHRLGALDADYRVALIDFDDLHKCRVPFMPSERSGTVEYMPPEALKVRFECHEWKSDRRQWDIWSLGVSLLNKFLENAVLTNQAQKSVVFCFAHYVIGGSKFMTDRDELNRAFQAAMYKRLNDSPEIAQMYWIQFLGEALKLLPHPLDSLIQEMLAWEPEKRPSIGRVIEVLEQYEKEGGAL